MVSGENVSTPEPTQRPWDRLPGENARWYARFMAYLETGSGRSVQGTYHAERAAAGLGKNKLTPHSWSDAALRFSWASRALAYDDHLRAEKEKLAIAQRQRDAEQLQEDRKRLRERERTLADRLYMRALDLLDLPHLKEKDDDGMTILVPDHTAFRTAAGMVKQYSETERLALGLPTTVARFDISKMSNTDLLTLYEQLTEEDSGNNKLK